MKCKWGGAGVKIIDNFLFYDYFKELQKIIYSDNFSWYYHKATTIYNDDKNFMFCHLLYNNQSINSECYSKFEPIKYFINRHIDCKELLRVKLNLYPNQGRKIQHRKHHDWLDKDDKPIKGIKVAILNFTDCNGSTIVDGKEIISKENKAILFKNEQEHYGITQDDKDIRIVLNIVFKQTYFKEPL